jgi:RNA polymerase sigma-70 factor (ECF subfamily)
MADLGLAKVLDQIRRGAEARALGGEADAALLERFVGGQEQAAFAVLLERHGPLVLAVGRRVLGTAADAEDVFQATFLLLAAKASSIRKRESVASWLYGVAHRLARKAAGRAARRRACEREVAAMRGTPEPAPGRAWRELQNLVDEELAGLPDRYRAALICCYLEGRTQEEASRELGCPLGTARSRLARGRQLLRDALVRRGVALSAGALAAALAASATAAVPARLVRLVLQAAPQFAAGRPALATGVSASAASLTEGAMRTMFTAKRQCILGLLLVGSLAAGTAGVLAVPGADDPPGQAPRPAAPPPAAPRAADGARPPEEKEWVARNQRLIDEYERLAKELAALHRLVNRVATDPKRADQQAEQLRAMIEVLRLKNRQLRDDLNLRRGVPVPKPEDIFPPAGDPGPQPKVKKAVPGPKPGAVWDGLDRWERLPGWGVRKVICQLVNDILA